MDLSTEYLGLKLRSPLIVGASPFADETEVARRLQDAGAAAIVMRSLFEEQIYLDELAHTEGGDLPAGSPAYTDPYSPSLSEYRFSPDAYLRQIESLKATLTIPVIASLNGCRHGGWVDFGMRCESAGADAIELNLYSLATDASVSPTTIEVDMLETVRSLKNSVRCPVAVKLSPFHTAPAHFVRRLEAMGATGVVLFNRLYQPGIDHLEVEPVSRLELSNSTELLLRLRWIAILSPQVRGSVAATGGVGGAADAIKSILVGAHAVQTVSALLRHGPRYLASVLEGMRKWMGEHGYKSIGDFRGLLSLRNCSDPAAQERANYQRILQMFRV